MTVKQGLWIVAMVWLILAAFELARADDKQVQYILFDDGTMQECVEVQPEECVSVLCQIVKSKGTPVPRPEPEKPCCPEGVGIPAKGTPVDSWCRICPEGE